MLDQCHIESCQNLVAACNYVFSDVDWWDSSKLWFRNPRVDRPDVGIVSGGGDADDTSSLYELGSKIDDHFDRC